MQFSGRSFRATQLSTTGSGEGRNSSGTTLVSSSAVIASTSIEGRRLPRRFARRKLQFHTAQRRDPGPHGFGQIAGAGLEPDSISHKQTCCLFHRASVACCQPARARLGVLIMVADCYACHDHIFQWHQNPLPRAIAMQSGRQHRARRDRLQVPIHPPAWSTSMRSLDMQITGGFRAVRFRFLEDRLCSCSSFPRHFLSRCAATTSWVRS